MRLSNSRLYCLHLFRPPHGFLGTQQSLLLLGVSHPDFPVHGPKHVLHLTKCLHIITDNKLSFRPQNPISLCNHSHQVAPAGPMRNNCKIRPYQAEIMFLILTVEGQILWSPVQKPNTNTYFFLVLEKIWSACNRSYDLGQVLNDSHQL